VCVFKKLNLTDVNETKTTDDSEKAATVAPAAGKVSAAARSRAGDKIRSELNIEKWPAIWQPSKSKNKPAVRTMEREVSADDGTRIISRVEVGYTQLGTLTTEEQKLLYVLIKFWEDDGKPDAHVFFSTRGLARTLQKKGWGTNVIEATTKSLRKLRTIPIEWTNSYYDQTSAGAVIVDSRPFTILGDLRIVERRQDGAVNTSLGYFKFDDHILRNLQGNFTKPVRIDEFFKLKSEIAQLVYTHVDLVLFDKSRYERRTRNLFNDLGLKNPEYEHMFERKRALERALRELEGMRLSRGVLKSATLEKTTDGKDYKAVFTKASGPRLDAEVEDALGQLPAKPVVVNNYTERKDPVVEQAEQIVRHFHKTVHAVDSHDPQSKEVGQALSLITQHGAAAAMFIVEYAAARAGETNFSMQHFGAVLSYASRAMAERDRSRRARETAALDPTKPASSAVARAELHGRGKRLLGILSSEQFAARADAARAQVQQRPFLAQSQPGSKLFETLVRAKMIEALDIEPMALIAFDPVLTAAYPWLYRRAQNLPL